MKITQKITVFFIRKGIIPETQQEIYEYGFELIFADIINFILILSASIWLDCLYEGLIYLLCFVSTRIFCGGFHAKTQCLCRLSMLLMFTCFVILYRILDIAQIYILFIGCIAAWIPIFRYAPIIHKNKQLSQKYCQINRKRALTTYALWTFIAVSLILAGNKFGIAIAVTLWIVSVSMICGKLKSA